MRGHWLGPLVGLCILGLAAPTWGVPMTATQLGEVTVILNPEFAPLDYVVGTVRELVVGGPVSKPQWGGRVAYVRDPDGYLFELFQSIPMEEE